MTAPRRIVVGVTGASGTIYATRFLSHLRRLDLEVHLVSSRTAHDVGRFEGFPLPQAWEPTAQLPARLVVHAPDNLFSAIASGSFRHQGMVVLPCSTGTVGRVAAGVSDSLLVRSCDVCLKERRPLILVVREAPLSSLHLRNLLTLSEAGALIVPASPGFYLHPTNLEELVDGLLARISDHLGLELDLAKRWKDADLA